METKEKVEIIYQSQCGRFSQRIIKVLAVSEQTITAYCYLRRKLRVFNIENILAIRFVCVIHKKEMFIK